MGMCVECRVRVTALGPVDACVQLRVAFLVKNEQLLPESAKPSWVARQAHETT